jgi:hypothetical protein
VSVLKVKSYNNFAPFGQIRKVMGTFAMWLEAKKDGLYENNIDDHKLVDMLNETYRQNRKLINRLAESEDIFEIKEKLRQISPKLLLKVEGLGKQAMLAALMGLGGGLAVDKGIDAIDQSDYVKQLNRSARLERPHRDAVASMQSREKAMNQAEKLAKEKEAQLKAMREKGRLRSAGGLTGDADWEDLQSRHKGGAAGYGFDYSDYGSAPVPR